MFGGTEGRRRRKKVLLRHQRTHHGWKIADAAHAKAFLQSLQVYHTWPSRNEFILPPSSTRKPSEDFFTQHFLFLFFPSPLRISVCHVHIFLIPQRVGSPEFQKGLWHPEGRSKDCRALELREDSGRLALDLKRRPTFLTFLSVASSLEGIAAAVSAPSSSSSSIGLLLPGRYF